MVLGMVTGSLEDMIKIQSDP